MLSVLQKPVRNGLTCTGISFPVYFYFDYLFDYLLITQTKKSLILQGFSSRGRGDRTPVNGFGDRRTTAVLFPYICQSYN